MDKLVLQASPRAIVGKSVRKLRASGSLPAVIYGHGLAPKNITINTHDFERIYDTAGHNTILDLKIEGDKDYNVLIHAVATDPVRDTALHADFYRVKMDEEIRTAVPLHFVGESTAVFQDGGSLLTNLEEVEIETLPANLPANIEVDIAVLDDFEKTITVADLPVPSGVKILNDPEELVVKVEPPRSDEELAELEEPVAEETNEEMEAEAAEAAEAGAESEEQPETGTENS